MLQPESPRTAPSKVRVFALGGLGEVGMNCLAIEQRGEILLVDCGVTFDNRGLGVDVVHPDFSALAPYRDRIVGVFLTHGHEDHIGALPYFLRHHDVPIWGPRYTLGLVRERAAEHEILQHVRLIEALSRKKYAVGSFVVEPIRVTHSIADATALAIETDCGTVIHTGDFKFDEAPPDGEEFDVARFEELGREGVTLLMSDSTNIDVAGATGSEAGVGRVLEEIVLGARGAVVVGLFASNVHRLRMLGDIARKSGRKIVPLGRSVSTHSKVARSTMRTTGEGEGTAYLEWPSDLVFSAERARELPRDQILGIATGTQAEANAALARLARGDHNALTIGPGDTVVMSSRVIPGNERAAFGLMGDLLRRGVELRSWYTDRGVHVSGHATRIEQKRMIEMVNPRAFIPLHGTLHHLRQHAALARELGVGSVCVLENGDVAAIDRDAGATREESQMPAGRVHVFAKRAIPDSVLRERVSLAAEGIAFVNVRLDGAGIIDGEIAVATRGLVDEAQGAHLLTKARGEARVAIDELRGARRVREDGDESAVMEAVRVAVRRVLAKTLGFRPTVIVSVQRG